MTDLLLDRAAAARRLSVEEIKSWGDGQRVFVSSVIDGFRDQRLAAAAGIEAVAATPVLFERFGGRDADPNASYLDEVASCDVYVGLLGERYGSLLPSRYSATHEEFKHAERQGLRLAVWAERDVSREGPQQSFLNEVRTYNVTGEFDTADELTREVQDRLSAIAAEDLSPWVKLGQVIFRANELRLSRDRATILATIKDEAVAEALTAMDSQWGSRDMTLSWAKGVYSARVERVESVSRTLRSAELTIALQLSEPREQTVYSMGGVSYAEATAQAIRVSWFGEPAPGHSLMQSQFQITDPFETLRELRPPAEALRPIAHVLITEVLALERDLGRITRFQLGSSIAGRRRLVLSWLSRSRHGQGDTEHSVDGEVSLP